MIYGVGNAIVDISAEVSDEFINGLGLVKGEMSLTDLDKSYRILSALKDGGHRTMISAGGSVANTIAGVAALGGVGTALAFVVGDDDLGDAFINETKASGTIINEGKCVVPGQTGRSIILITPDGERTMMTSLGVSSTLARSNIDLDLAADSEITFVEGYLFDSPHGRHLVDALLSVKKPFMTLSDSFCVKRNHEAFMNALSRSAGVIGNASEMRALSGTSVEDAVSMCASMGLEVFATRSSAPVLVHDDLHLYPSEVEVPTVYDVVDTTGAGDQFAAGVLHGLLSNLTLEEAAARGVEAAGLVIQHRGARPIMNLVSSHPNF